MSTAGYHDEITRDGDLLSIVRVFADGRRQVLGSRLDPLPETAPRGADDAAAVDPDALAAARWFYTRGGGLPAGLPDKVRDALAKELGLDAPKEGAP